MRERQTDVNKERVRVKVEAIVQEIEKRGLPERERTQTGTKFRDLETRLYTIQDHKYSKLALPSRSLEEAVGHLIFYRPRCCFASG